MNKKLMWGLIIAGVAVAGYFAWKKGFFSAKLSAGEQQAADEMQQRSDAGLGVPQVGRPVASGPSKLGNRPMRTVGGAVVNLDLAKAVKVMPNLQTANQSIV
jgi:hypothetical protein